MFFLRRRPERNKVQNTTKLTFFRTIPLAFQSARMEDTQCRSRNVEQGQTRACVLATGRGSLEIEGKIRSGAYEQGSRIGKPQRIAASSRRKLLSERVAQLLFHPTFVDNSPRDIRALATPVFLRVSRVPMHVVAYTSRIVTVIFSLFPRLALLVYSRGRYRRSFDGKVNRYVGTHRRRPCASDWNESRARFSLNGTPPDAVALYKRKLVPFR